ncbi:unnamed protein product [Withania somnifera]
MDRRILGLSLLTVMICSLLVTETWADEEKNPDAAAANQSPPASERSAPAPQKDADAYDGDENYVFANGFHDGDQFGPEIIVVGH